MSNLVFGSTGQLAQSLRETEPDPTTTYINRRECDLKDGSAVRQILNRHQPKLIVNAAAYTAVDLAEEEAALAHQINAEAVGAMAEYASAYSARLIHISTDFVFDGAKDSPYQPGDPTAPLGEYGASKLAGENAALKAAPESTMIIRTSWVYSEYGKNFVKTMLKLMQERESLSVVNDQRGVPTYARDFAEIIWQICNDEMFTPGIYHWTDAGNISWHEFALAIQDEAIDLGLLEAEIPIEAIPTENYPTPAERPKYSVLDCSKLTKLIGIEQSPWRKNLKLMLTNLTL